MNEAGRFEAYDEHPGQPDQETYGGCDSDDKGAGDAVREAGGMKGRCGPVGPDEPSGTDDADGPADTSSTEPDDTNASHERADHHNGPDTTGNGNDKPADTGTSSTEPDDTSASDKRAGHHNGPDTTGNGNDKPADTGTSSTEPDDTDASDGRPGSHRGTGTGDGDDHSPAAEPGPDQPPRIPLPRASVEDTGHPLPELEHLDGVTPRPAPLVLEHRVLKSLLGAWALAACSPEETAAVEEHLGDCGACADEARRLREAVGLLHSAESLDLDPSLRARVLEGCLQRRPPRVPVPEWAAPYDAETARLDALLQDFGDAEWHAPVRLRWFRRDEPTSRRTTVAGVIAHLLTVDGLVAVALGLKDPMGDVAADRPTPSARTEAYWRAAHYPPTRAVRAPWREQTHDLVRTVSFTGGDAGKLTVPYGDFELTLHDAMLDRAFECWVHAEDIAEAVDYPYDPPSGRDLHRMVDLAARMLPQVLAARRREGLAAPPPGPYRHLVPAGEPGRSLRLEIEGSGGGEWLIPLDSPAAIGSAEHEVAHIALDGGEFCRLAAGHVSPEDAAAGQVGDREAIRDVLFAAASLSRM